MKKVLIIAHDFPPYGNVGSSIRMVKFAKYLPDFSWQPIVLSTKHNAPFQDNIFLDQISGETEIFYTKDYLPSILRKIKRKMSEPKSERNETQLGESDSENKTSSRRRVFKLILEPIRYVVSTFILVPDRTILWSRIACKQALEILRRERFDVMLTTSPPHGAHWVGLILKARYGIPWVVDLRDQWVDNPVCYEGNGVRKMVHSILEKKVAQNADIVVSATESGTKGLSTRYNSMKSKFITINNGFDPQDFESELSNRSNQGRMVFTHVGHIGSSRDPTFFLKALSEIKNMSMVDDIKVRFTGNFQCDREFWEKELPAMFVCQEEVAHKNAIREMSESDVLLIFQPDSVGARFAVPGKLYEYIATGRPILAMVSQGPTKELIETEGLGITVDYGDVQGIKKAILRFHSDWRRGILESRADPGLIERFSRKNLTQKLAGVLDTLSSEHD